MAVCLLTNQQSALTTGTIRHSGFSESAQLVNLANVMIITLVARTSYVSLAREYNDQGWPLIHIRPQSTSACTGSCLRESAIFGLPGPNMFDLTGRRPVIGSDEIPILYGLTDRHSSCDGVPE